MDTDQQWRYNGTEQIEKAYGDAICIIEPYPRGAGQGRQDQNNGRQAGRSSVPNKWIGKRKKPKRKAGSSSGDSTYSRTNKDTITI